MEFLYITGFFLFIGLLFFAHAYAFKRAAKALQLALDLNPLFRFNNATIGDNLNASGETGFFLNESKNNTVLVFEQGLIIYFESRFNAAPFCAYFYFNEGQRNLFNHVSYRLKVRRFFLEKSGDILIEGEGSFSAFIAYNSTIQGMARVSLPPQAFTESFNKFIEENKR